MAEASPAKKLKQSVKGYLYNVSPLKDPQKSYFDATLQHGSECSKVVVFTPQDHTQFQNAEKNRCPVTLEDVILQPSKESYGKRNVFYTHSSRMSCVCDLGDAFNDTLPAKQQEITLAEKLVTKPQRVNIIVKIIKEEYKGNSVVRDGRYLPRTTYTVADATAYISLTVWCEHNITIGEWYHITNVSLKQFNDKTSLTTTKDTRILNIPSQGATVTVEVPTESIKCEIIGANVKIFFICHRKHNLSNITPSSPTVYCPSCKTHYKTSATTMKISVHLDLKPETGDVIQASAEDEVIMPVITVKPNASRDEIIQSLMALPPMQVTICNSVIVKIEDGSESHNPLNAEIKSDEAVCSLKLPIKVEPLEDSDTVFYSPPDHGLFSSSQSKKI
ncbi:uncharacterized protein si:dkey-249d8.1 [Myxocyprinus asiaticus]|uniref:uncharacterized protein si:dkey-249d8.1 n=1 Tax=Myxocyprinus asiaticus TaxID=70543 RepID=UPI00222315E5|nr:uncharacterized protein si:dkey-249d8.1 [Myxocyprinus asiaticus]XP_051567806.1 uncharacterized protein si:dkey-249d8.1 [Myxocyprinus asiaticus]